MSRGTTGVPMPQEDVVRLWNVKVAAEAARVTTVCTTEAFTQEAVAAWETITAIVRDAEAWDAMAEREARKRVLRLEAESIMVLASTHEEPEGFGRRVALLEGELAKAHRAQDAAEEKS
jgi:hypothetical protein